MRKTASETKILREIACICLKMLTANRRTTYPSTMEQMQPGEPLPSSGGGKMSSSASAKASAKDRVDDALSRLESMVDERLRVERVRADELAQRLDKLERQHDELKRVAIEVEGRLERAMEYIRSLLAADQQ
ncbi:DUF4164 family protein [Reyranella sp.]|jgi:hypothetical protein|uniref:DUF4164 family protein n=1 Tax=Reyranella sp. TaxID=1929291 RepID=UPI0012204DE8|nr:DUF4164 family protein [Reyranella sp.]TAJ84804.1 MAG: DUF4164 family protein [Reyranella sp.]